MKYIVIFALGVCGLYYFIKYFPAALHGTMVYNCTWVEITPDIPITVKEECRRLRSEKK